MPDITPTQEPEVLDEIPEIVEDDLVLDDELLVEDVSIDGMCGVY